MTFSATSHYVLEDKIQAEVRAERIRQIDKFPEQAKHGLPNGTGEHYGWKAYEAREMCDQAAGLGVATWKDVLYEEFWEALAEEDPAKLRAELIQVQAVAQAWVEDLDRKKAAREREAQDLEMRRGIALAKKELGL